MANNFLMTNDTSNNRWKLQYNVDQAGTKSTTLKTGGKFTDRDIRVDIITPQGSYQHPVSVSSGAITPALSLDSNATTTYGLTTTQPSGTTGTQFLTFNPAATVDSEASFTSQIIINEGYLEAVNNSSDATSSTTVNGGTNYYMPIVSPTFKGGALSGSTATTITLSDNIVTSPTTTAYSISAKATGTISRGAVTYSNAAGAITAHSNTTVTGLSTASINAGSTASTIYLPAASCTVSGGTLSTQGYTKSNLALTLASGNDSNMANITLGAQNTSTYPYYFKVHGSTPKVTGTTSASVTAITDAHTAGYLPAKDAETIVDAQTASPAVSVNATSANTYISLKRATMTVAGTNTVTPSVSLAQENITFSTTNTSGVKITATGGGSASVAATATTNTAGYAPASTQLGSATLAADSTTTSTTQYITAITVPSGKSFTLTNNGTTTVTNNNAATVNNSKGLTVNSTNTDSSVTVNALPASGSTATGAKTVVTAGRWATTTVTPSASAQGPFYGAVNVKAISTTSDTATVTTLYKQTGMDTYFNSASSGGNVVITPQYTNTAGYLAAHSTATGNGGVGRWNIKTTTIQQGITEVNGTTANRGTAHWDNDGWLTAGSISAATFSNTATSGVTYVDISSTTDAPALVKKGYLYINQGYTDNLKISLAKLIADDATITGGANDVSSQMLNGVTAYDKNGNLLTGNIPTRTASNVSFNGKTVTVTAGYYASDTTKNMGVATIKSGAATISSATYAYNSTNDNFAVSGSATVVAPSVSTAGYVSSSEGTKQSNTATLAATVPVVEIDTVINGTAKVTPVISKVTTASGNNATNITASVSNASTTKPTSGYYVAVSSAAKATTVTAVPSVKTNGYGTTDHYNIATHNSTSGYPLEIGANSSGVTYLPVTAAVLTASGTASATTTVAPGTVSIAANTTDLSGKTRIDSTPSTSTPSTTYYIAATATAAANATGTTSSITGTASAGVKTAGYASTSLTASGSVTGTATATTSAKSSSTYYFPVVSASGFSLNITAASGSSDVTVGTLANGKYPITANNLKVTGTLSASTSGYFTSGSATDSDVDNVVVGNISAATITLSGNGALNNKAATATFTGITQDTTDDYNNGLKIQAVGKAGRDAVTYTNTAGYISAHTSAQTLSSAVAASTWNGTAYYLKGVTLTAPSTGTRQFDITVPNGTDETITFHFHVDANSNVYID